MKKAFLALFVGVCLIATTGVVYATTYRLYTVSGFVESLIEKGVIPAALASKAREVAALVERFDGRTNVQEPKPAEPTDAPNAAMVEVSVSQLIENASLAYNEADMIKGPILLVHNMSTSTIQLDAKRGCQVVYRIYAMDAGEDAAPLYDSSTSDKCQTDEKVTWLLPANETRMFPIVHQPTVYPLSKGAYRFELEYPGYGRGNLTVTVQ